MRLSRLALILAALLGTACDAEVGPARAQWLVTISTDAPVPQFGDRLLVEIVNEEGEACSGCRRLFDASTVESWPLSFGVIPDDKAVRVRARLYRAEMLATDGQPASGTAIDAIVELGEPGPVGVRLAMSCFGMDADLSGGAACDPVDGAMRPIAEISVDEPPLSVGSWPPAVRTPCSAAAEQGSVCVEGGAFLLGSAGSVPLEREGFGARPERIVILSPFFLETSEVTVGDYLDLRTTFPEIGQPAQPSDMGLTSFEYCNYRGDDDASTREYPLNCVDFELAKEICEKRGMRLPTEAEWEFAAGNATRETTYPWGEDEDICAHAVVARGENYPQQCRNTKDEILPPGSTPSFAADATDLGIVDLGGNVSEWVADGFEPYGEACWSSALQTDPSCEATTVRSVRGGNWSLEPATVVVVRRDSARHDARSPSIGFRCAKDG